MLQWWINFFIGGSCCAVVFIAFFFLFYVVWDTVTSLYYRQKLLNFEYFMFAAIALIIVLFGVWVLLYGWYL